MDLVDISNELTSDEERSLFQFAYLESDRLFLGVCGDTCGGFRDTTFPPVRYEIIYSVVNRLKRSGFLALNIDWPDPYVTYFNYRTELADGTLLDRGDREEFSNKVATYINGEWLPSLFDIGITDFVQVYNSSDFSMNLWLRLNSTVSHENFFKRGSMRSALVYSWFDALVLPLFLPEGG